MLLPQFTPEQGSLRVRAWRRLQALGCVNLRTSCYVLPRSAETLEDLQWLRHELAAEGVEALLIEADLVDGLTDAQLRDRFNAERDLEYESWIRDARKIRDAHRRKPTEDFAEVLERLQRSLQQIEARDHCGAPGREVAAALLATLLSAGRAAESEATGKPQETTMPMPQQAIWVTRQGIHIDRIASAWLIRRHIDPRARFRFVAERNYEPGEGEVRFDMFSAEFTHVGDRCTFEVLLDRAALDDPTLRRIGDIVHDIDLKEDRYERPETAGVRTLLAGLIANSAGDEERLERGTRVFDDLYRSLSGASARRAPS
mgnify:CR=1 FL=1